MVLSGRRRLPTAQGGDTILPGQATFSKVTREFKASQRSWYTYFMHLGVEKGFRVSGTLGSPTSPPPAVNQATGPPSSRHGPVVAQGGIILACPGWIQVEQALTSGTRPRGSRAARLCPLAESAATSRLAWVHCATVSWIA
ncbi:hypothetical protein LEMLEM_LOCUS25778 [Lemmus lemmus]